MNDRKLYIGREYRHFKGRTYRVLGVATHSETSEKMVVYQAQYGERRIFVRPYKMFMEKLDTSQYPNASQVYRFELLDK